MATDPKFSHLSADEQQVMHRALKASAKSDWAATAAADLLAKVLEARGLDAATDVLAVALRAAQARGREEEREACAKIAEERRDKCYRQADRYEASSPDGSPYWHASERCAGHEARHIAETIRARQDPQS